VWGLIAAVIQSWRLRLGLFTPTEAAVVAAFYGSSSALRLRTLDLRKIYEVSSSRQRSAAS